MLGHWHPLSVSPLVPVQMLNLGKPHPTPVVAACVGLLSRVGPLVHVQLILPGKTHPAPVVAACVRLLSRVGPLVP